MDDSIFLNQTKWRSSQSTRCGVLAKGLTEPTLLEMVGYDRIGSYQSSGLIESKKSRPKRRGRPWDAVMPAVEQCAR